MVDIAPCFIYACCVNDVSHYNPIIAKRFRGFLPVVIDIETAGFNDQTDAILEIAAVTLKMDDNGELSLHETVFQQRTFFIKSGIFKTIYLFNKQ